MTGPQTKTTDGAGHRPRLAAIDIAKGIAIIAMVAYHFSWDLSYRQLIAADVGSDLGWRLFARGIAGAFVFLVGVNLVMAARTGFHPRPYLRRLAILLAAALLVTGFTYYAFGAEGFVFFGICQTRRLQTQRQPEFYPRYGDLGSGCLQGGFGCGSEELR